MHGALPTNERVAAEAGQRIGAMRVDLSMPRSHPVTGLFIV
jgi:hypothetical protein